MLACACLRQETPFFFLFVGSNVRTAAISCLLPLALKQQLSYSLVLSHNDQAMIPTSGERDTVFGGSNIDMMNGATTTAGAATPGSATRASMSKWSSAWKGFSQKTQQASREFAAKTSQRSKALAQQTQQSFKSVSEQASQQSKKLAEAAAARRNSSASGSSGTAGTNNQNTAGGNSGRSMSSWMQESSKKLEASTAKLAASARVSSAKLVESTKQSSQKLKELSKRETEIFLQQVQQQRQKAVVGLGSSQRQFGPKATTAPSAEADGKPDDILVETMEIAVEALMEMIATKQQQEQQLPYSTPKKWEMDTTPVLSINTGAEEDSGGGEAKTMDHQDIYKIFLNWSREAKKEKNQTNTTSTMTGLLPPSAGGNAEGEEIIIFSHNGDIAPSKSIEEEVAEAANIYKGGEEQKKDEASSATAKDVHFVYYYNVTKAFERFEKYVDWMYRHRKELKNLTTESVADAARAWNFKLQTSKEGRLVWYVDVGSMDVNAIKGNNNNQAESTKKDVTLTDSLRWLVFMSHIVMFHHSNNSLKDNAMSTRGLTVLFSMGDNTTMVESVTTLLPMMDKLAKKLDNFTIGTLPIKLEKIYILPSKQQRWVGIVASLMKALLSKKLKNRVCVVQNANNGNTNGINNNNVTFAALLNKLGKDRVPVGYPILKGTCPQDIIFGQYVTSAETEAAILAAALEGDDDNEGDSNNAVGGEQQQEGNGPAATAAPTATGQNESAVSPSFVIDDEDDDEEGGNKSEDDIL